MSKPKNIKLSDLGSLGRNNTEILNKLTGGISITPEEVDTEVRKVLNDYVRGHWQDVSVRYGQTASGEMMQVKVSVPTAKIEFLAGYPLSATIGQIRSDLVERLRR